MKHLALALLTTSLGACVGEVPNRTVAEEPAPCATEDRQTYYADADGDGFGDPMQTVSECVAAAGFVTNNTDCDDAEGFAYPGGTELCGDAIDNDCEGSDACVDNLAARWAFTSSDGLIAEDDSGNGLTGSLQGGLVHTAESSLLFDGVDDYVLYEDVERYQMATGSISLWFYTETVAAQQGLISKDAAGNGAGGQFTIYVDVGGAVRVRLESPNANYEVASLPVSVGAWHHLSFNFGGNDGMSLLVDGELSAEDPYTGGLLRNNEPLVVGASTDNSTAAAATPIRAPFAGLITEVQIYDRQLVGEEVAGLKLTSQPL